MYVDQYIAKEPQKTQEAGVCFSGYGIESIYKVNQIIDCFRYFDKYIDAILTYSKNFTSKLVRDVREKKPKYFFKFLNLCGNCCSVYTIFYIYLFSLQTIEN